MLDVHVRTRIQDEIARLRSEEEEVHRQIEVALERENIDKERDIAGEQQEGEGDGEGPDGVFRSSDSLRADLEAIQKKVERFHNRSSLEDMPEAKESQERLLECYRFVLAKLRVLSFFLLNILFFSRNNPTTSLNCWKEVADFKTAVQDAEHVRLSSFALHLFVDSSPRNSSKRYNTVVYYGHWVFSLLQTQLRIKRSGRNCQSIIKILLCLVP